jgi:two-component system response regulator HydG
LSQHRADHMEPAKWTPNVSVTTTGPDIAGLIERLYFDLPEGMIWLDQSRVTLMHADWLAQLRSELVPLLGYHQTRALFTRLGYSAGCRDAKASLERNPAQSWEEMVLTGGQMHTLHGSVSAAAVSLDLDEMKRHCHVEFIWKNSIERIGEDERRFHNSESGCWMEVGYASGFLTTCYGAPVLFRELACCSGGHDHCRGIAKFADQWEDGSEDMVYFSALQVDQNGAMVSPASMSFQHELGEGASDDGAIIVGRSTAFNAVQHKVHQVADTRATVLLLGESGVGKSVFATQIHGCSPRSGKPFVEINCAAIPDNLLEAELFGVEKGAFTGSGAARPGRFEEANGGSIFLDEISTLSLSSQGKLLRVLQNQKFERLGSNKTIQADVRVIAATNEDLEVAVLEKRFRADLYYRLNVFPIQVPSLRQRKDDLPVLVDHFVRVFSERYERNVAGISVRAYRMLVAHSWPGNIRELENVIERAVIMCQRGERLDVAHFPQSQLVEASKGMMQLDRMGNLARVADDQVNMLSVILEMLNGESFDLAGLERMAIEAALALTNDNVARAAKLLGVTRAQIDYRLKKWQSE